MNAPRNGPIIIPNGGKKNVPIIIPTSESFAARELPPNFFVIIEGDIKSNIVIASAVKNIIHMSFVDNTDILLSFARSIAAKLRGGPGRTGSKDPVTPSIATIKAKIIRKISIIFYLYKN